MNTLQSVKDAVLHLFFPHLCAGCGTDVVAENEMLCLSCLSILPDTFQFATPENPVEQSFWGRVPVVHAGAMYYFTRTSLMQSLLHRMKYNNDPSLARWLGKQMGFALSASPLYKEVDVLVPVPLHRSRQQQRGYNQAALLCEGIAQATGLPVATHALERIAATETQTQKNRQQRWQNMEDRFMLHPKHMLQNKRALLVDDVITTGATLEAAGRALLQAEGLQLYIAALCHAAGG